MSTFLQLVNKVEERSGTIDTRNQATVDVTAPATLRHAKIVNAVSEAWTIIQNGRNDWRFMRGEFQHALATGQARYTAAEMGLTDLSQWGGPLSNDPDPMACHDPAEGVAGQHAVRYCRYDAWRATYARGVHAENRPANWSLDFDGKLCVGPTPDRAWVLTGEYVRTPQLLALNADVPRCLPQYHDVIVYRALMLLADHDEAPAALIPAQGKYAEAYRALVNNQTEPVNF